MPSGDILQLVCVALSAMFLSILINAFLQGRFRRRKTLAPKQHNTGLPVFLFENETLIDATTTAQDFIARRPKDMTEFDYLISLLGGFFPTILTDVTDLADGKKASVVSSRDDSLSVDIAKKDQALRITLNGSDHLQALLQYKDLEQEALQNETDTLRYLCDHAPQLIWQEDSENGQVVWANKAYLEYSDRKQPPTAHTGQAWPSHRLFDELPYPIAKDATPLTSRRSLKLAGQEAEHWFDVTSMPGPAGALHYASCANDVMRAEEGQKSFMATIANTFAQLSIGLAIFDSKRRLASYNPAFGELTGLPTNFLIGRPSIHNVLDRLRDLQILPEPKDYTSFRQHFAALEAEAKNGTYVENWEMPDGQTFRVTGRPHPNGALAFLFEDVTAEVSLTRRFRTEIETGQSVLDSLPDAIAVFSATNMLVVANDAYFDLWGQPETTMSANMDLRTSLRTWKADCVSTGAWRRIEDFAKAPSTREPWSDTVVRLDGRQITCAVTPLPNNMTLVRFLKSTKRTPTLQKLMTADPALRMRKS